MRSATGRRGPLQVDYGDRKGSLVVSGVPSNIEAEQALLGILLYDNAALIEVDGIVSPEDFHEPLHGRYFARIQRLVRSGVLVDPILMADDFRIDPSQAELGGLRYLADMVDVAPPSSNALHYAKAIRSVAIRREVMRIAEGLIQRAVEDPDADGADLMAEMEREVIAVRAGGTVRDDLALQSLADVSAEVVYGMERPGDRPVVPLGLAKLDNALSGAERGELIVLGGRPSMGKSALASCLALNVANAGLGAIELNGEMTTHQMARRHLTDLAFNRFKEDAPAYRDIKSGNLTERQRDIIRVVDSEIAGLPLMMAKRSGLTLGRMRAMLRRQKMLWDAAGIRLSLVVIDHAGLVRPDISRGSTLEDQTLVSAALKEMADELDVLMIALAQLNRDVEKRDDKRPQLSDLRSSGTWEQDADIVIGCYRDAYYARREREPKDQFKLAEWMERCGSPTVEAILLKVREGDVSSVKLWSDIGRNAIRDERPEFMLF
jgi:replicative DNA helicase